MQNGSDLLAEPVFHSNDKLLLLRDIEPDGVRAHNLLDKPLNLCRPIFTST
jgi:hypothetical protein